MAQGQREVVSTGARVAVLLAVAAVVAALIGGRAALLGDSGSDALNEAVREDVREGARIVGDVRRLYEEDAAVVHRIAEDELLSEEIARAASRESGNVRLVLEAEAAAYAGLADVLSKSSQLADGDPGRALAVDGGDLLGRLAEIRAERSAELAALDPDATQQAAEDDTRASSLMLVATVPVAIAFLLGALAEALGSHRRLLIPAGYSLVAIGLIIAFVVEVTL